MSNYDINGIVGTTFYTIDRIKEVGGKYAGDALILYFEYIKKGRIDGTNQPRATDIYMMNGLGRSKTKFGKAKDVLKELKLVEVIPGRGDDGLMNKRYTRVNYIMPQEKIQEAMDQNPKSRVVDIQNPKIEVVDKMQLGAGKKNGEFIKSSSDHQNPKNPPSGKTETNALSINNKMLKEDYYTTYNSGNGTSGDGDIDTELISAQTIRDAYKCRPNRKGKIKDVEKLFLSLDEAQKRDALLEMRLLTFEYRLNLEDINMCNTCANAINNRSTDDEAIAQRVDRILEAFETHKCRNEETRLLWEKEINEFFKKYIGDRAIGKPEAPKDKDGWIKLYHELYMKGETYKLSEWFPGYNFSKLQADWAARCLAQQKTTK